MYCGRLIFFLNNDQIKFPSWNALAHAIYFNNVLILTCKAKVALNVLNDHHSAFQFLLELWILIIILLTIISQHFILQTLVCLLIF